MARHQWHDGLLLFFLLLTLSLAASPTTFCKCTCFTNSTIIPLNALPSSLPYSAYPNNNTTTPITPHLTCNDCTRQFCLDANLPICAEATEDDVFRTCFQRDSTKDEAIVLIFLFATVGLLGWAAMKPWLARWRNGAILWRHYDPVNTGVAGGE